MRMIGAVVGIVLVSGVSAHAGCKIVKTGVMGTDSVLTGTIDAFEAGPPPKKGQKTGIYFAEPCDFVVEWTGPYPKACKIGRTITARGDYIEDIEMFFFADSISCK